MSRESYAESQIPNFEGVASAKYLDAKQLVNGLFALGAEVQIGTVTGDTDADLEVALGFEPAVVIAYNLTDPTLALWTATMPDGDMAKLTDAPALSQVTTTGITPNGKGFTIGQDGDLNVDAQVIHYIAFGGRGIQGS